MNPPLWEYAHTPRLARDEDDYFRDHPLFRADAEALDARFIDPAPLVDLGCGVGRLSIRFARKGFPVVSVDLSRSMLETVGAKAQAEGLSVGRVEANLCRLGCFPDGSFSYALSMFSTLGMIRGAPARRKALAEAYRILKPGGRLALHAHNIWLNLRERQGRRWLLGQAKAAIRGRGDAGDRRMTYRGIRGMEVHLYTWRELSRELRRAGFRIDEVVCLNTVTAKPVGYPWLFPKVRAGGWIVFAHRPVNRR